MRIIAGKLKGAALHMTKDKNTRPLKDMARESVFNLLKHSNKISFELEKIKFSSRWGSKGWGSNFYTPEIQIVFYSASDLPDSSPFVEF